MRFTYRLLKDRSGYLAECIESDAAGEGKSPREAIESLRVSLYERMFRPDAVAPPEATPLYSIDLALTDDATASA